MERKVVWALKAAEPFVRNGLLRIEALRLVYNRQVNALEAIDYNKTIGKIVRELGLKVRQSTGGRSCLIWDNEVIEFLYKREGIA